MDAIMAVAGRHGLHVLEDTCQGVGGGYKGRKLGTIGHIGAFSFNFYKNMTAGEGGGVCTADDALAERALLRHRPVPFLLDRPREGPEAVRPQRRAGVKAGRRDAERAARPPARHDRRDAGGAADDPGRRNLPQATSG
ncbi:MAG: DegT/DnrJ/EryC1/StrS family aminotransferase [Alphaproteobacteria bacterium]